MPAHGSRWQMGREGRLTNACAAERRLDFVDIDFLGSWHVVGPGMVAGCVLRVCCSVQMGNWELQAELEWGDGRAGHAMYKYRYLATNYPGMYVSRYVCTKYKYVNIKIILTSREMNYQRLFQN